MRKITITFLSISVALMAFTGCNKWLEATSSSQISGAQLFQSRAGFHEALSGVYLLMGDASAYGRDYTWFVNELPASPLVAQNGHPFTDFQNQRYTTAYAIPYLDAMWKAGYNIIANVNKILLELENHRDVIQDQTEYQLLRGELLAIRAYVHFDIIRMWGLDSWDGDNAGKLTVPYVTVYQKEPFIQRTYAETAILLNQDLDEAIGLLEVDPIRGNAPDSFQEAINADGFWSKRTYHLNWYAAQALKVRVLMWQKQYSAAETLSNSIIEEVLQKEVVHWLDPFQMLEADSNDQRDWTFSCEHLFTLEIPDYYSKVQPYFFTLGANANTNTIMLSESVVRALFQSIYFVDKVDEETGVQGRSLVGDIRGPALMLKYSPLGYQIYKYYSSSTAKYRNRQPMIRLSELYMNKAEVALRDSRFQDAANAINAIHLARGVEDELTPDNFLMTDQPLYFLWEEYVREFPCEAQIFYFRKRVMNSSRPTSLAIVYDCAELVNVAMGANLNLIFPYPTEETSYGHIQEL